MQTVLQTVHEIVTPKGTLSVGTETPNGKRHNVTLWDENVLNIDTLYIHWRS